jgi:hypothetical protein
MISDIDQYLFSIALGIRFRANFSIEDQFGKIIDSILYSKESYFNKNIFPLARSSVGSRDLLCEKSQDNIHIDNSNIIIEIFFNEDSPFNKTELSNILVNFESQIIKGLLKEYSITEIRRIGYIRRYIYDINALANSFVSKTIGHTLGGINDINLSFSKKIPLTDALVKKDVLDYDNSIFNIIKRADRDEIYMSIDYQMFYDPFLPSYSMINFQSFLDRSNRFIEGMYLPWLNKNYAEITDGKE